MAFDREKARKGSAGIEASKNASGGGDYTPMLTWKAGEKRYIKFLTPFEEIPTVDFHNFMIVDYSDNNKPIYRSFISPQDPGALGPEGYDPIKTKFGLMPKKRQIAVAVELEPVYKAGKGSKKEITDWTVAQREYTNKDDEEVTVPNVGLIVQSHIFFGPLAVYAEDTDVEDYVWEVVRSGGDQNTTYVFRERGDAPEVELDDDNVPDLDAYLSDLASEERMHQYIDHLPSDWVLDTYAEKSKKSKGRGRATAEVTAEEPGSEPETNSFDDLRSSLRKSKASK